MMSSTISVNDREDSSTDSYNGQLLKEIKEVSKALYLNNAPQRPPPLVRSKSVSRTTETGLALSKKKKKPFVPWDWKKPLKAIAHLGQRRFDVCFHLHVHSIEGLPLQLDGTKLVVQWKRKDEVMSTQPSKVLQGTAEFEETLMHTCSVYGSKNGPHRSAKYQVKLFLVYASPVDAPWLILGKHWIDLTRILPLSLEELEGTGSTRKWSTSFKLSGLAESAVLNLSFDYSIVTSSVSDSTSGNLKLKQVGSVPSMDHISSPLDDGKVFNQVSSSPSLDLSQSIDFLYEKFSEQNPQRSTGTDIQYEPQGRTKVGLGLESDEQADDSDDIELATDKQADDSNGIEFALTGKEAEMFQQERCRLEESTVPNTESSRIEIIDVHEILKDEDESFFKEPNSIDHLAMAEQKSSVYSDFGGPESACSSQVNTESSENKYPSPMDDPTENETFSKFKSSYKAAKISTKSLSLDDITESVANDFLNMLELEECSYVYTSDGEPTSPRESLLREFEKDALASGNFLLDLDGEAEYVSDIDAESNDFSFFATSLDAGENKHGGKSQLLKDRRKAKVLEDVETETLLRDCDIDDDSFGDSLCVCSDGFGSPIDLPDEERLDSLPCEDNIGHSAGIKEEECIPSTDPLVLRKYQDPSHLIMQVSIPVVLVSELGNDILEILQTLAASGIERLCSEVNSSMPLEDITGKTIEEVVDETILERIGHHCSDKSKGVLVQKPSGQLDIFPSNVNCGGFGSNMRPCYVPLQDIASLAIDEIYLLAVEGLKIQCNMSDQDPPSEFAPKLMDQSNAAELMSFSLTLDEWLRLDHGMHHAYQDQASSGKSNTFRNKLTIALQVLLRDPLENNEPVGATMLALVQVERSMDSSNPPVCSLAQEGSNKESFEYDTHLWKITDIGLAGLKSEPGVDHPWCTKSQQQSGSHWLLASGTVKTIKCEASESKMMVVSNPQATRKSLDTLWSITSKRIHQEGDLSSSAVSIPFTRNSDVIFSNEITERL